MGNKKSQQKKNNPVQPVSGLGNEAVEINCLHIHSLSLVQEHEAKQ